MSDRENLLVEAQERLAEVLKPFQQELNKKQKLADFVKTCIRCVSRDDFLQLDELLRSNLATAVVANEALNACAPTLEQLRDYAAHRVDQYRLEFIADLRQQAQEANLALEVDFPRLHFLKGIEGTVDFHARVTVINNKKLKSIDPRRIVTLAQKIKRQLYDRPFDPQAYIDGLFEVYTTVCEQSGIKPGYPVPAQRFYLEYVLSLQSKAFFSNMDKGKFRGYSLDQFAVDLWRYFQAGTGGTSSGQVLKLRPGRNRALWLIDQDGERRQISGISFLEDK